MTSPPPQPAAPSNLVRLAPLQLGDLPAHPDLPGSGGSIKRPDLSTFITAFLDDGAAFLSPANFSRSFKHHSTKPAPPSAAHVEVLTHSIPASHIMQVQWSSAGTPNATDAAAARVPRSTPRELKVEHWVARKSIHRDVSGHDAQQPGHASWGEFVFGLRDDHSTHESDFTPTLYDAHHVLDWNAELDALMAQGKISSHRGNHGHAYSACTLAIYEMCHAIPAPLRPRCFAVLVATASVDADSFIAVTVPVVLGSQVSAAFYSSGRNVKEGADAQKRKAVVMGVYAAVETVKRDATKGEIEWIMATASDAKGNLPMWMQKMGIPGAVIKDVAYFMKWIKSVDRAEIQSAQTRALSAT